MRKTIDAFNIGIKKRDDIVKRMRQCKIPDKYIAQVFGLHQTHVYHICGKASKFTFNRDRVDAIVKDLQETNLPLRQIAIKHGVCVSTVRDHAATKNLRTTQKKETAGQLTRRYASELAIFLRGFYAEYGRNPVMREYPGQLYRRCYVRNLLPQQNMIKHFKMPAPVTVKQYSKILEGVA